MGGRSFDIFSFSRIISLKNMYKWQLSAFKGSCPNYYNRRGPTKPQNRWWSLPAPHPPPPPTPPPSFLDLKRWCLYCIATPLSSSREENDNLTFRILKFEVCIIFAVFFPLLYIDPNFQQPTEKNDNEI